MYSSGGFCLAPVQYKSPPVNTPECQTWAIELWEDNMPEDIEFYRNEQAMEMP